MRKPPIGATCATLAAIALLCGLGSWQVRRLHWKTELLRNLDAAYRDTAPPELSAAQISILPRGRNDFRAVRLTGHFAGTDIAIGPRTWNEQPGYNEIGLFQLAGGGALLIDRGWTPMTQKIAHKDASIPFAMQQDTITGVLHAPDAANMFVPRNEAAKGIWYRWDIPAMTQAIYNLQKPRDVLPVVLYQTPPDEQGPPIRAALRWTLPNDHLSYACFWFAMAGILAVMFYVRFMRGGNGSLPLAPDRPEP